MISHHDMNNPEITINISDDEFGSDHDSAAEFLEEDNDNLPGPTTHHTPKPNTASNSENPPRNSTSSMPVEMPVVCVICNDAPAYRLGPNISATCGMACNSKLNSKLQAATGLPNPNNPRTNSAFRPPDLFRDAPSRSFERTPTYSGITTRSLSRIRMCDVCHVRPRCQRGGKIYPTCGLSCAAKLQSPGSVEMCDFCKKRPKVVINGKKYPQCGNTCRDKAKKTAETAANAAVCTSCILCWKSKKSGESDFCSEACQSLADSRAPFLIELPRGHVAFKKVADLFTSEWQTSKTHSPTVKRVYMVVMKNSSKENFEKYRRKIGSQNGLLLQRKRPEGNRWLVFSRECGFGAAGDLEPCSSNKCLLCSVVKSSFNSSDFPGGIITSGLNRAVERYRCGKKSSSKIAALAHVVMGREAELMPHDLQVDRPLPPPNTDSVHLIGVRNGSKVDLGDIIVYDGDAVRPVYLISYE